MKYLDSFQALKNYFDSIQGFGRTRNTRGDISDLTDQDIDTHNASIEDKDESVDDKDEPVYFSTPNTQGVPHDSPELDTCKPCGSPALDLNAKLQPPTLETVLLWWSVPGQYLVEL